MIEAVASAMPSMMPTVEHRRAEYGHEIDRQQRVDHLRRDVHQQRDEAEGPHGRRNLAEPGKMGAGFIHAVAEPTVLNKIR